MPDERPKVLSINRTPGDFVRDTQHLTCLEIGAYNQICDNLVVLGQDSDPPSIPDDDVVLANLAKLSVKRWRELKPRLCSGPLAVLVIEDGRVSQARVVEEIENARHRMNVSQRAGVASGEARRRKGELLRERMLNGRSNSRSTDVASEFKPRREDALNSKRTGSEPVTSHESRVISHKEEEREETTSSRSSSEDAAEERPIRAVQTILRASAPKMKTVPPDQVRQWAGMFHGSAWQVAALALMQSTYLADVKSPKYFTRVIEDHVEDKSFPMRDAEGYVSIYLQPEQLQKIAQQAVTPKVHT